MKKRVFLGLAAVLAACAGPTSVPARETVELTVQARSFAPADTAYVVLRNGRAESIGFNLCHTDLERRTSGGWEVVEPRYGLAPGTACLTIQYRLASGDSAPRPWRLAADLPGGTYRLRTGVGIPSSRLREIHTPTFTVAR